MSTSSSSYLSSSSSSRPPMKRTLSESSTGSSSSNGNDTPTRGGGGGGSIPPLTPHAPVLAMGGGPPFKIPKKTDLMGGGLVAFHRRESRASTASSVSTQLSVSEDDDADGQQLSRALDSNSETEDDSNAGSPTFTNGVGGGGLHHQHHFSSPASSSSSSANHHLLADEPLPKIARVEEPRQYSDVAHRLMSKMGYKSGQGLGKASQGIVEPVGLSKQKGRRGLGMILKGLEEEKVEWDPSREHIVVEEEVKWMHKPADPSVPDSGTLEGAWMKVGRRKKVIDDETRFCDPEVLASVINSKSVFDILEEDHMRSARSKCNPFESIKGGIFLNRAAMKMANLDAVFDFMFTNPRTPDGQPVLHGSQLLYFADVCAGPGGFSEYVLWRKKWRSKGFGFTLKGSCDFKLEDFFAGPAETFEPHYGVNGKDGDGNIFVEANIRAFENYVLTNTGGKGVHFMMADGGFSVVGQENIQEILSKQLYLCQFLVALGILAPGGHFVCKLFDLFTPFSVGLLYLMRLCFVDVCIHKPNTSRPANSERYIVCRWKHEDTSNVHNYMLKINSCLNELGMSSLGEVSSESDVNEIVPMARIMDDRHFVDYVTESNNVLGDWQMVGLNKIAAFYKDVTLKELRQGELRDQCLAYWKVPNEVRRAPVTEPPQSRVETLWGRAAANGETTTAAFLGLKGSNLLTENLIKSIRSVYDWKFVLLGAPNENEAPERGFFLGLGRTRVFRYNPARYTKWEKVDEATIKFELPANTLIYAEIVREMRGEHFSSRKVTAVHVIDAAFIGGEDLRQLDFKTRNEQVRAMVKALNKFTRTDYVVLRAKEVFGLEKLQEVLGQLKPRIFKSPGAVRGPRLTYDVEDCDQQQQQQQQQLVRYFVPTGISLFRIVRDPFMIALSKTHQKKYWFNFAKNESFYKCPPHAVIDFRTSFERRLNWLWEEGVRIDPEGQEGGPVKSEKVQADDFLRLIAKLTC